MEPFARYQAGIHRRYVDNRSMRMSTFSGIPHSSIVLYELPSHSMIDLVLWCEFSGRYYVVIIFLLIGPCKGED